MSGVEYSMTSATSTKTPADNLASTNWILFAEIFTPVIRWGW